MSERAWQRGLDFILKAQKPDVTWQVQTRLIPPFGPPYFETGYPYGHDQFISISGAAWAVLALSRALGPPLKTKTPILAEAVPVVPPWAEAALFGTARDLEGLDPGSAS